MKWVDILSRLSEHTDGKEDNKDIVLLPPKLFVGTVELVTLNEDILSRVRAKVGLLEDSVIKGLATTLSGRKMGTSFTRRGASASPKTKSCKATLFDHTMTHQSLGIQASLRHMNSSPETIGGPACSVLSTSISLGVRPAKEPRLVNCWSRLPCSPIQSQEVHRKSFQLISLGNCQSHRGAMPSAWW